MTNEEIYELMERFEHSSLSGLRVADHGFELELNRQGTAAAVQAAQAVPAAAEEKTQPEQGEKNTVNAPLVGCFYAAPAPDQPAFVKAGDEVKKGQTLCLIEAMKMMSEIPAPCDCVIEAVLKENGDLVSFREPMFRYRPV